MAGAGRPRRRKIGLQDFIEDARLAGSYSAFKTPETWRPWMVFSRAIHGEPLRNAAERKLFTRCTGIEHYEARKDGYAEAVAIVGRQAGKTQFASLLVSALAALHPPVPDGHLYALLIAQDHRAAVRTAFSYIKAIFDSSPMLKQLVVNSKTDTLELNNGIRVAAYPCNPASVRGLRAIVAVCDELAFYRSSEMVPQDKEMLRALRPCLATTGGRIVCPSSPYGQSGTLWEMHRRHYGKGDGAVLIWQADAPTMNATLPADYIKRMREDDPEAYRSEVLGEFRQGLTSLIDPAVLDRCVGEHQEIERQENVHYEAFVDPSGGRRDPYALAIGHLDKVSERVVVDCIRRWEAPFNPSGVTSEIVDILRRYQVSAVTGDRYAGEWPREQFRAHRVRYDVSRLDKSRLYLELLASLNAQRVELPSNQNLITELRCLERRRGPSGRDRVDHPPNGHDDLANAAAGLVYDLIGHPKEVTWTDLYGPEMQASIL